MDETKLNEEFYKGQIGKFANIEYISSDGINKMAKGKLIGVSDAKQLLVQGDYKSWTISFFNIVSANFSEWRKDESN